LISLEQYKDQFFRSSQWVHLNNAGLAPINLRAKETLEYWSKRFFEEGFATDHDYMQAYQSTRTNLAELIGCSSQEVSFFLNTSGGINQVAFHLGLKPNEEILMWDQEYPSHLYPWQQASLLSGAKLKIVESDKKTWATPTDTFLKSITDKTRVVAFSWMQYQSGAMMDWPLVIQEAKKRGIFVFVDAMQGLGILPYDLWKLGVDALVGGSHKWLTSPVGAGFLALKNEHISKMKPHSFGSMTFGTCDDPSDFECQPKFDATKFEPGAKQVFELTALGASTKLTLLTGVAQLHQESLRLKSQLHEKLQDLGYSALQPNVGLPYESPILNVLPKKDQTPENLSQKLKAQSILHAKRGPGVRLSVHAFNNENDIEKVVFALKS
jgi:cysteine desulfurase/selenocysteine lyase